MFWINVNLLEMWSNFKYLNNIIPYKTKTIIQLLMKCKEDKIKLTSKKDMSKNVLIVDKKNKPINKLNK